MLADGPCNSLGRVLKVVALLRRTRFCVCGSLIQVHVGCIIILCTLGWGFMVMAISLGLGYPRHLKSLCS